MIVLSRNILLLDLEMIRQGWRIWTWQLVINKGGYNNNDHYIIISLNHRSEYKTGTFPGGK